jgi:3-oxoacyl-[acyl-carrier protein] reductase
MAISPVILVTGASRGLGRGIAEELAKSGFSVAIHYSSNKQAAEETQAACAKLAKSKDQKFGLVSGNIGIAADRASIVENTLKEMGRIDGLVNNAGIAPRIRADITEATEEIFDEVIGVNLKGPYFLSQLVVRYWLKNPGKSLISSGYKLIFVSSISADTASVNRGEYCIAKAGLAMANQLWAVRLAAEGIQVIELRPGIMFTDMTSGVKEKYDKLIGEGLVPQKRWGTPADVGLAVRSIVEGNFGFSTGVAIHIDGGFQLRRL